MTAATATRWCYMVGTASWRRSKIRSAGFIACSRLKMRCAGSAKITSSFRSNRKLVRAEEIAALAGSEAVHQGIYAEADPLPSPDLEAVAHGILLALDQVTDPYNVGAILRSAAAFGATALVTTERHSPQATGVLAKAASGALEYVPIIIVTNLARALVELKELGVLVVGLDSSGETDLALAPLSAPIALVVGAEGRGLRELTRRHCDIVARLVLPGRIKSLNVSNATALALYIAQQRTQQR